MARTIVCSRPPVKAGLRRLQLAWRRGTVWLIKRLRALVLVADGRPVPAIAARRGVCRAPISAGRAALLVQRWASLVRRTAPGRPATVTATQRARRQDLVLAGPDAAGSATGGWQSALIQDLIWRACGRSDTVPSLRARRRTLGCS